MFILPPSINELRERIQKRGLDSEGVIEKRMKNALKELGEAEEYDYLVINDQFELACSQLQSIVEAKRLEINSQRHEKLLIDLLS